MNVLFTVLIIIVCILLILIVLVQNSKGGGLASNFASSNQFMGVRKTADFLEKATWTLAGALLFLCLLSSITTKNKETAPRSAIESSTIPNPEATPKFPAQPSDNKTTAPSTPAAKPENKPAPNQKTK
jgi:preprotein translocase subunit SecG